jgi:hypothetical protein
MLDLSNCHYRLTWIQYNHQMQWMQLHIGWNDGW